MTGPALHAAQKLALARLKKAADPLTCFPRWIPSEPPDAPPAEALSPASGPSPACSRAWMPGRRARSALSGRGAPGKARTVETASSRGPHLRPGRSARLKLAEATGQLVPSGYEKPRPAPSGRVNRQSQNDKAKIHSSCSPGNLRCSAGQSESS